MENEKKLLQNLKTLSILYIEDEDKIREDMVSTFKLLCKEVYPYSCAENALDNFDKLHPDIIFSDISLESTSGLEFARNIRSFDKKIPIILLSAHTDTSYLLEAAKLKLIAYLTKPITFEELKTTLLEAVLDINLEKEALLFPLPGKISYDTYHKVLYDADSIEIKLSASENKLLEFFIKNKNRTLSQEEIKSAVWSNPYEATDTALKSLIHKLRSKIGKKSIKNLSGIGYYLNIDEI